MKVDAFLIKACLNEERKAQYTLYTQCYSFLMSICVRYMKDRDEAKDILNQGFYKILKNLDKYDSKIPFEAWSSKIMVNTIIDEYRKNKKRIELVEHFDILLDADNFSYAEANDADEMFDAEAIELMVQTLPKLSRIVFSMYAIEGYKHKEIAEKLGMNVNTSKWHVSAARKRLQKMIKTSLNTSNSLNYGETPG